VTLYPNYVKHVSLIALASPDKDVQRWCGSLTEPSPPVSMSLVKFIQWSWIGRVIVLAICGYVIAGFGDVMIRRATPSKLAMIVCVLLGLTVLAVDAFIGFQVAHLSTWDIHTTCTMHWPQKHAWDVSGWSMLGPAIFIPFRALIFLAFNSLKSQ
jgi:hypothetical protein